MVKGGMTPLEAIQSATIETAILFRMEDSIGQIKPNYMADIIAFKNSPLDDISEIENVIFVMKDGVVYKN